MRSRNIIFRAILSALVCFPLCQQVQAQETPDPGSVGGSLNTADGTNALGSVTTGAANSAFGWFSLFSDADASFNTGVGAGTLLFNNAGDNTAVGAAALLFNTTGIDNTAVGAAALVNNTDGSDNNAVGAFALNANVSGFFNNAVGHGALQSNVIGNQNNALGDLALTSNTSGGTNTAVGDDALFSVTTGNSNTALGDEAGSNLVDGEGNIYIGAQVQAGGTGEFEFIRIGDDTAFTFPYDTFIAGIANRAVDAGANPQIVLVDDTGKLGTVAVNGAGNKVASQTILNESRNQQKRIAELEATVERQQKGMEVLTAQLKEQATQIQKVSAQLEVNKPAPQVVTNKP